MQKTRVFWTLDDWDPIGPCSPKKCGKFVTLFRAFDFSAELLGKPNYY